MEGNDAARAYEKVPRGHYKGKIKQMTMTIITSLHSETGYKTKTEKIWGRSLKMVKLLQLPMHMYFPGLDHQLLFDTYFRGFLKAYTKDKLIYFHKVQKA